MKRTLFIHLLLLCFLSIYFTGCNQNTEDYIPSQRDTKERTEAEETSDDIISDIQIIDNEIREDHLAEELNIKTLPEGITVDWHFMTQRYILLFCHDPNEAHGISIYATNYEMPDRNIERETLGYRKLEIEIPEDLNYDSLEFTPALTWTESGGYTTVCLAVTNDGVTEYIVFGTMILDEFPNSMVFRYDGSYGSEKDYLSYEPGYGWYK